MKKRTEKKYDCIEDKRSAQLKIYEEIKNLSMEEELIYWKNVREEFQLKRIQKYPHSISQ
jgi:hypothetical protein